MMTPSETGSCVPLFDGRGVSVVHRPTRTASPGATSPAGNRTSERMYDRPASFTPVTIRRTLPGMPPPLSSVRRPRRYASLLLEVLVRRTEQIVADEPQSRFGDAGAVRVEAGDVPDGREHH